MFSFFDDAGRLTPLTFSGLAAGIKELVGLVGLDPAHYAAHSLPRGVRWHVTVPYQVPRGLAL